GELDYPLAQLGEVDSHRRGTLWYQTQLGHSGQRVRLEAVELAFGSEPEINARASPQFEGLESGQGLLLHPCSRFRGELRRELFGRHARGVLALVVIDLMLRDDLADRQSD